MKAIRIHEPTGISGLVYEEAPDATPGLDDVLVKVAAERGVRAERRLGAQGLGRWMAGRLHFHVPVIPRSSGDGLTPLWKPSQPSESQLAATLARLK